MSKGKKIAIGVTVAGAVAAVATLIGVRARA
jgi:hypothetical protein